MRQHVGLACAAVCAVGCALVVTVGTVVRAAGPRVIQVAELADTALGPFHNRAFSYSIDQVADDHGIRMGSIGSDIFHDPGDSYNEFWMVTDRGPNGNPGKRTFVVPTFDPVIVHVRVLGTSFQVLSATPIVDAAGRPVTGLSNVSSGFDELPWNFDGSQLLHTNPNGLDTEGLVRTRNGAFWLVDEYSPSLLHVAPTGQVMDRFVPIDSELGTSLASTPTYRVKKYLPRILNARRQNRGFEGIAISPDETTLFLAMQSPLDYPTAALGRASRLVRIFRFDIGSERVTGEYVYQFDEVCSFLGQAAGCGVAPGEMKISGLSAVNATSLLVDERTDTAAKIYRVDISNATNILDSSWDAQALPSTAATPALETLQNPAAQGIAVLSKALVADLTPFGLPTKIEGVTLVRPDILAVSNDNDFGLVDNATFDAGGKLSNDTMVKSKIFFIELPSPVN